MLNIGVMGSTKGTDMEAVINEIKTGGLNARISVVISNKNSAYILERAKKHSIKAIFIDPQDKETENFDREVADIFKKNDIGLILLIGYMRFLSKWFVNQYRGRIMNIHPSLLPAFAGLIDENVHAEVLKRGCKITGCTLHFVDEEADTGPIILQKAVNVADDETVGSLKEKVQKAEQETLIKGISLFVNERIHIEGNKVKIV